MSAKNLRKRILEEWRGLPETVPRPDRNASVADVLKKILPKLGLDDRLTEQQMRDTWKDIVGEFLASHSAPFSLREGILSVQVVQASVRYELDRSWKKEILKKLQERFGAKIVRDVKFH